MAAFNDPQKLADAIALAASFKTGQFKEKRHGKSRARAEAIDFSERHGAESITGMKHHDPARHSQLGRVAERSRQYDATGFVQPSQRKYSSDALDKGWKIGQLRAEDAVIGKAVFDFLNRSDMALTPAATPQPLTRTPATSQMTANFTGPRSPVLDSDSTPLTPESMIQGPRDKNNSSPADTSQMPADEQEADQLAVLLSSFSFKERSSTGNGPGHIMDRFLELLAKNVEVSEHFGLDKQSCVKNDYTTTRSDAEHDEKKEAAETTAAYQCHQSNMADQPDFFNTNTVPATTKSKQLCSPPSKGAVVLDDDQYQEEKLPFTGQFNSPSDVQFPMPNTYCESTAATCETQFAAPTLDSRQPQPMQGLSASRWAHQPSKKSG
ncbi:uncharacterized protein MAM_01572 [Metarhizium album ARSEF 1941]|uniref:Uncharacterized protein n=1 Tax=Metarhizium album (strain ARSEF 1941) TaxID=1081103 RepID=A0A0B2X393_METAS|nr:uncharacterized protein MAM_01572 [Metarhizium album ARSEF 1941]KHO00794.1 hypothetical protein MAM_01572 [Metarhizium album ARSEF 1941]